MTRFGHRHNWLANAPMPELEFLFDPLSESRSVELTPLPFVMGRDRNVQLTLISPLVSKRHAEIVERGGQFWIRDLDSRNGVFVNGKRIRQSQMIDRDIVHVANCEFRFCVTTIHADGAAEAVNPPATEPNCGKIPPSVLYGRPLLTE